MSVSSTYTTATEEAAKIRAEFKRRGWTPRMVGVRSSYYSGGSSIDVEIKDPSVGAKLAKQIAEGAERIHRDQWGEILSGGNRFVSVRHSAACTAQLALRHAQALGEALAALLAQPEERVLVAIRGTRCSVGFTSHGSGLDARSVWGETSHVFEFYDSSASCLQDAAFRLALLDDDQTQGVPA